jgi:threonyl-tRNA synthetase
MSDESLIADDDHRALAQRLDLCHVQDGMVYWHPRGWTLFRILEEAAREHCLAGDYREVRTPQLLPRSIWETSGHWQEHAASMFAVGDSALKPVNCPGSIAIVKKAVPSWRDLPMRIAEFGLVHRDEASGSLLGLMRLRQFTQDDGHIFCTDDQIGAEVARFCRELPALYRRFGFDDVAIALSLRPDNRLGDDAWWDRAERELAAIANELGLRVDVQPGAGAIYGPKLEFVLRDRRGRPWQCGTIQLDFVLPQRFDVRFVDSGGERRHVVMLHRALYGSIERFLGILLEQHGAALPAWLAPEQIAVVPVGAAHRDAARRVAGELAAAGLRARLDDDDDTLARRVAIAHHDGVPFVVVIGDVEVRDGTLAVRGSDGRWNLPVSEGIADLARRCRWTA